MNKLFTKIATLSVGLAMAVGVGVAVGNNGAVKAAASDYTATLAQSSSTANYTDTQGNTWTLDYTSNGTVSVDSSTWLKTGTNSVAATSISLETDAYEDYVIDRVTIHVKAKASTSAYGYIYIGGTEAKKTSSVLTNNDTELSFDNSTDQLSGSIKVAVDRGSSKNGALYLGTVVVEYSSADAETFTVSFNGNGGTGSMSPVSDVHGSYTLPANGFTAPSNKAFTGWKAGNAGDLILAGGSYNVTADVTFYAQWADAYTVTYSAGTNGSGSYAHTLQPAGTYTLLPFADLTGVSASTGYRFKNYTVGGVDKNPGDTITLSAATAVTVNFEEIPEETTYVFATNYSTYASSWSTTYGEKTLAGTTDVGGDYAATIVLARVNKQTSGVGSDKPYLCGNTNSDAQMLTFTLTETGKKIKDVTITFEQRGSNNPTMKLFKGNSASGSALDTATIGTKNTLSTSTSLNDVSFSVTLNAGGTSNKGVALTSIYISVEAQAAYGTTDHIKVTSFPNTVYHIGETYDGTGLAVTAYDGATEATANFKDVTASVATGFTSGVYTFDDGDVPTAEMFVEYTEGGTTFSADPIVMHVYALAEYQLVESAPADWSGNYLIVATNSEDELRAMNGALATLDVEGNHKSAVEKSAGLIENGQELEFTIASYSTGYSIQGKDGKYIGWASGSGNGLTASDTPLVNTLSYDNGVVIAGQGGRQLTFNNDGQGRFRYYNSGTVQLYKLKESDDVSDYADMFLETLSTGTNAVCKYNESTHVVSTDLDDLKDAWKDLADLYDALSAADKEQFRLGVASSDPSATNIAKALALYDHIATAYGTRLQGEGYVSNYNFMARSITPVGNSIAFFGENNTASTTSIMVIISIVSLTAIGGYFFLRKRKVQ